MKTYYVYILASLRRVLYTGITGNLETRLAYHRSFENPNSFTARYGITRLVYFEDFTDANDAIAREKQIKSWRRAKKIKLIRQLNPDWIDLAPEFVRPPTPVPRGACPERTRRARDDILVW